MSRRFRALLPAVILGWILAACGGNGNGNGSGPPPPSPGPGASNPCASVAMEGETGVAVGEPDPGLRRRKTEGVDRDPRWRVFDALWTHRQREGRAEPLAATAPGPNSIDIGEIAVLQDEGDLIAAPNQLDVRGAGLRFTRNAGGGYDVTRIDAAFRTALGNRLTLTDDDSSQVNVPFAFSFYGQNQTVAFVNSDGNVTFEEEDRASTERNVARLLTGPPRVAPFFADLDPTTGAGRVFANATGDQYTVTWCNVRGFDSLRTTTTQVTLLANGTIEMKLGDPITLLDAIVGVSPGRTGVFTPVNLSDAGPVSGGAGAVGERFAERAEMDTVQIARKFYTSHPDSYDQLIMWTDAPQIQDAFAYETTVANEVQGIGIDTFNASRDFGSAGRLRSFAVMDFIGKYPDNPQQRFLGENSTLSVLGQEVGHRWLAFFDFRDRNGNRSDVLLGRGAAHWSFFFDSDASVMEGNDIEDLGGGSFRTVAAVQRYSLLDQYAMGLIGPNEVPPFFYVESPMNVVPPRDAEDAPRMGVTFNGTRRDVLMQDIIATNGPRIPSAAESARVHRQAFIFIVGAGRSTDNAQVEKIDRIRREWETFFLQATDGRMRAITTLR
jgi:hypothetical protein